MKTLLFGSVAAIAAFIGIFTGFYWWQFHELPDFGTVSDGTTSSTDTALSSTPQTVTLPPASSSPEVLGTSSEYVLPSTLYGLINGLRRDLNIGIMAVNPALEATAQRLILTADTPQDPTELAKSLGFPGKEVVTVQVHSGASAWEAFTQLQEDQRAELLLKSKTFTDIGAALLCDENRDPTCTTLTILGAR